VTNGRDGASGVHGPRWKQRTHLAWAPIARVAEDRERYAAEQCSPAEQLALAGRHVQSLAGTVALKAAVIDLLSTLYPDVELSRRDVEIGHEPGGAPEVRHLPVSLPTGSGGTPAKLFVSITHTKEHAIGLAVLEQRMENR
jgi:phosphopantetheinyl transferase (holo-ACP synthase)